jgi:hypothetical protein
MSFWSTSDGEAVEKQTEFDAGGGFSEPIPEGTHCLAAIEEAKWVRDVKDNEFVQLKWAILAPEEYAGRKVPQKLWVGDDLDPTTKDNDAAVKKQDKAKRMLAAIDTNAGGKLMQLDEMPTDTTMTKHLVNKPMVVRIMVWAVEDRQTGETISGNWIGAVSPKVPAKDLPPPPPAKEIKVQGGGRSGGQGSAGRRERDDEIPF